MTTLPSTLSLRVGMQVGLLCVLLLTWSLFPGAGFAHELSGYLAAECRHFFNEPLYPEQQSSRRSAALQLEYFHRFDDDGSIIFVPFVRYDYDDPERSHGDIRELNFVYADDAWRMRIGIAQLFWGVTEFVHLVDIINQTDLVENINREQKLGQPLINFSFSRDWGDIELFVLPGFRERTFPGKKGRLRSRFIVDTGRAEYENDDQERHIDYAIRYSNAIDILDFGVYHFRGTGREPVLEPRLKDNMEIVLIPYYEQIDQTGLDLQATTGQWLIKTEALLRSGRNDDFFACTGGIEYTFIGFGQSRADLGLIMEYAYDDRGEAATTTFENDLISGLRLTLNDVEGTEILWGLAYDLDYSSKMMSLEISRRIGNDWRIDLESRCFFGVDTEDMLYSLKDDDYLQVGMTWYF